MADTKTQKKDYIYATGKRRSAVARVRLYENVRDGLTWNSTAVKKGDFLVNGKAVTEYFPSLVMRHMYSQPLKVTNTLNKYTWTVRVTGGGPTGQLNALIAGLSNALAKLSPEEYRPVLKDKGFLTRDARIRERRKVGTGGKARRAKQSPKR